MRKPKFTKAITIVFPPDLYQEVKRITDEQEISVSHWFRDVAGTALNTSAEKETQNDD